MNDAALERFRALSAERGSWLRAALVRGVTYAEIERIMEAMRVHKKLALKLFMIESAPTAFYIEVEKPEK